ncbi:MAG: molecular chaperone TorD family protein [Gemmatimonadota bacterium]
MSGTGVSGGAEVSRGAGVSRADGVSSGAGIPAGETLLLLARALDYPEADSAEIRDQLIQRLGQSRPETASALEAHRDAASALSLYQEQEVYAATFDVNPAVCLYAGYHLFGDSYQRGAFMAQLNGTYSEAGFSAGEELPDNLCVVLRFLARCETIEEPLPSMEDGLDAWVRDLIDDAIVPALKVIVRAFKDTKNPYAPLLQALLQTFDRSSADGRGDGTESGRPRSRPLPVVQTNWPEDLANTGAAPRPEPM